MSGKENETRLETKLCLLRLAGIILFLGTAVLIWRHSWKLGLGCTASFIAVRCISALVDIMEEEKK